MTARRRKPKRNWTTVWGRPGQPIAYVEERPDDGTFAVTISGRLVGHFSSEEAARDFAGQVMESGADRDGQKSKAD